MDIHLLYNNKIKTMDKVYIVNCETITLYDDGTDFDTSSVHTTKDGAIAGLRNAIESRCVFLKDNYKLQFDDEDYADDFDGYDTFDEFWEDFIKDNMSTFDYWSYSTDELTINIYIKEVELSN